MFDVHTPCMECSIFHMQECEKNRISCTFLLQKNILRNTSAQVISTRAIVISVSPERQTSPGSLYNLPYTHTSCEMYHPTYPSDLSDIVI